MHFKSLHDANRYMIWKLKFLISANAEWTWREFNNSGPGRHKRFNQSLELQQSFPLAKCPGKLFGIDIFPRIENLERSIHKLKIYLFGHCFLKPFQLWRKLDIARLSYALQYYLCMAHISYDICFVKILPTMTLLAFSVNNNYAPTIPIWSVSS